MQSFFSLAFFVGIPYQQLDGGDRNVSFSLAGDTLRVCSVEEGSVCTSPETLKEGLARYFMAFDILHLDLQLGKDETISSKTLFQLFTLVKYFQKKLMEVVVSWTYDRDDDENGFLIEDLQEVFDIPVNVVPS